MGFKQNQEVDVNPGLPSLAFSGVQNIGAFFQAVGEGLVEIRYEHRGDSSVYGEGDVYTNSFKCYVMAQDSGESIDEVRRTSTLDERCSRPDDATSDEAISTILKPEIYFDGWDNIFVHVPYLPMTDPKDIFMIHFNSMTQDNQPTHGAWFWSGEKEFWPQWGEDKYTFQFGDGQPFERGTTHMIDYLFSVSRRGDDTQPGTREQQERTMREVYTFTKHGRFVSHDQELGDNYKMTWRMRLLDTNVPTFWYSWSLNFSSTVGVWMGVVSGCLGFIAFLTPLLLMGFRIPILGISFKGYAPHVSYEIKLMEDVKNASALNEVLSKKVLSGDDVEMAVSNPNSPIE